MALILAIIVIVLGCAGIVALAVKSSKEDNGEKGNQADEYEIVEDK